MGEMARSAAGGDYVETLQALREELAAIEVLLAALPDAEWRRPTRLPGWDVLTLVAHLLSAIEAISHGAAEPSPDAPVLTRTTYYRYDPQQQAPNTDARARRAAKGQTPASLRAALASAIVATLRDAEATAPATVIATRRGTIRMGDYLPTRVLEACIHGLDLGAAIGAPRTPTPGATRVTAAFLDAMLAGPRPVDLADNIVFIEVATGRRRHPDPRLPLVQ